MGTMLVYILGACAGTPQFPRGRKDADHEWTLEALDIDDCGQQELG